MSGRVGVWVLMAVVVACSSQTIDSKPESVGANGTGGDDAGSGAGGEVAGGGGAAPVGSGGAPSGAGGREPNTGGCSWGGAIGCSNDVEVSTPFRTAAGSIPRFIVRVCRNSFCAAFDSETNPTIYGGRFLFKMGSDDRESVQLTLRESSGVHRLEAEWFGATRDAPFADGDTFSLDARTVAGVPLASARWRATYRSYSVGGGTCPGSGVTCQDATMQEVSALDGGSVDAGDTDGGVEPPWTDGKTCCPAAPEASDECFQMGGVDVGGCASVCKPYCSNNWRKENDGKCELWRYDANVPPSDGGMCPP